MRIPYQQWARGRSVGKYR